MMARGEAAPQEWQVPMHSTFMCTSAYKNIRSFASPGVGNGWNKGDGPWTCPVLYGSAMVPRKSGIIQHT